MRVEHISAVSAIEKLSFPQPWPQNAYRREIVENRMALRAAVLDVHGRERQQWTALNDVVLHKGGFARVVSICPMTLPSALHAFMT